MPIYKDSFDFVTQGEFDTIDLTLRVRKIILSSRIYEGIVIVYTGHTTGAILVNEYDIALMEDLKSFLRELLPTRESYSHPVNAYAHLRSLLFSSSRVVPVTNGRPSLGTWQSIYWVEMESRPRRRTIEVIVIGDYASSQSNST